jgi:hypothetical protein
MSKHIVSSLKELTKDFGSNGDVAVVAQQDTNYIAPLPVIYTKIDDAWTPDRWYPIDDGSVQPEPVLSQFEQGDIIDGVETESMFAIRTSSSKMLKIPLYDNGFSSLILNFTSKSRSSTIIYRLKYYDSNNNYIEGSNKYSRWTRSGDMIVIPAAKNIIDNITDYIYVRIVVQYIDQTKEISPSDISNSFTKIVSNVIFNYKRELGYHEGATDNTYEPNSVALSTIFESSGKVLQFPLPIGARYFTLYCDNNINEHLCYNITAYKDYEDNSLLVYTEESEAGSLPCLEGIDALFSYGGITNNEWVNSRGGNNIVFSNITDTGNEYILPVNESGQYTSSDSEYRSEFTWYCVGRCPGTCYNAGQYLVSNLNVNSGYSGVEISSGWYAYNSAGVNHLLRSKDRLDFSTNIHITNYAVIVVSGDVNGIASIFVNGEKMTDNWNINNVGIEDMSTIYFGKRVSGQLSGTDIYYKFLAFAPIKQTDEDILTNSQYLMNKYIKENNAIAEYCGNYREIHQDALDVVTTLRFRIMRQHYGEMIMKKVDEQPLTDIDYMNLNYLTDLRWSWSDDTTTISSETTSEEQSDND